METLHVEGVKFIWYLQRTFAPWTKHFLLISHGGDPRNSFLLYFPIAYNFNSAIGLMVLWSAVLSEWLNLILKWMLRGERPYWWVEEHMKEQNIHLKQYPLTCETGPGSPSGHVMVTASVLCTLMPAITAKLCKLFRVSTSSLTLISVTIQSVCWLIFIAILVVVSVSRVFIATHFPHQVILGALIGILLSLLVQREQVSKITDLIPCICVAFFLAVTALFLYVGLSFVVFDPSLSITKAQQWCADPKYIHLDTTPFYSLVRDIGVVVGVGVSHLLIKIWSQEDPSNDSKSNFKRLIQSFLSVACLQLLEQMGLPLWNRILFYCAGFIKNVLLVVIIVFVVPSLLSNKSDKSKSD
ncbi:predicted protein [Nematostella vectensis]|uniref:Glucose-6-phosphatase n=1 Tax=Nematostella vectensis TaxID=45351 RepID=A7SW54_NEMVE|nr:glucose-6-phosphatase 2 [Nematostella vectensis]EDO32068.1 predicted protein [Nematostella vectensis]|eukprot:XP_001624168.1 predicted protein [Nematostella vectensis]